MEKSIAQFEQFLLEEEKSPATTEKYLRDVRAFFCWLQGRSLTKREVIEYKQSLCGTYAPASINSMLVSLNVFFRFAGFETCRVRLLKIQKRIFSDEGKELTAFEYRRLLACAKNTRLGLVMQTLCETGIRVSELRFITVESLSRGYARVDCKGKSRTVFLPRDLCKSLSIYAKKIGITAGCVFVSRNGTPLNRSNVWRDMKALCLKAKVSPKKVFPHNLRHLFARTFYSVERDIVRLADLLGHSSINTTRIYTVESGQNHRICLERVHRVLRT